MAKSISMKLTGDVDEDAGALLSELDSASMALGMPLAEYAEYLESLAYGLRGRARQVREEVEAG